MHSERALEDHFQVASSSSGWAAGGAEEQVRNMTRSTLQFTAPYTKILIELGCVRKHVMQVRDIGDVQSSNI